MAAALDWAQAAVSEVLGIGSESTFSKSSRALAAMTRGFWPKHTAPASAQVIPIMALNDFNANAWLASNGRGRDLFHQVRQFRAALGSNGEAVQAIERQCELQTLVGFIPQLARAENFHSHDALSGGLHLPQDGDDGLG